MYWLIPAAFAAVLALALLLWREDKTLSVTEYSVCSEKLPEEFDGFKIAHVSDLQNCKIGKDNIKLTELLKNEKPDIIAITGDLADSRHTNIKIAVAFAREAAKIAPVYYVTGNHEARLNIRGRFEAMDEALRAAGVSVMHNERRELGRGGAKINLVGVDDPMFFIDLEEEINKNTGEGFNLLLAHHPEFMEIYARCGIDLALTGHAHGGQIRLPKVGGLFAPGQGVLPEYDAGEYDIGATKMILSRGIGNSLFPFRINNRPEVCRVLLKRYR